MSRSGIDTPLTLCQRTAGLFLVRTFALLLLALSVGGANAAIHPTYIDGRFTLGDATQDAAYGLQNTFKLESRPSATKTIYLDFTGHHSVNNSWGHNIVFPSYDTDGDTSSFSTQELTAIQMMYQNVAEDFLPFNVNVTTRSPGTAALRRLGTGDQHWGMRVIMTQATAGFGFGIGGDSGSSRFDDSADNPVFVFNKGVRKGSQTATHEVGHTFGLSHDGVYSLERHPGTGGFGRTSWGPVMGAPFDVTLSQWSNGDYAGATNVGDDYSLLTSRGFGFRDDDNPSSLSNPQTLNAVNGKIADWGIIERRSDVDYYRFTTAPGSVDFNLYSFAKDANLDIGVKLYDSSGALVGDFDPSVTINIDYTLDLEAGSYTFAVDGVGNPGRNSDYGSLGFYEIDITLPLFADLDENRQLDAQDWIVFQSHAGEDLSGLSANDAYFRGDLNGDGQSDLIDFGLFKEAFVETHGEAAFVALLTAVPEPGALSLTLLAAIAMAAHRNQIR